MKGNIALLDNLPASVQTAAYPHPLRDQFMARSFAPGLTISELVDSYNIEERFLPFVHVVMSRGGETIHVPPEMWDGVRPKAGTHVSITPKVEGPAFGALLAAIVSAAAPTIAAWLVPGASAFMTSVVTAAITVIGGLVVNALVPPASSNSLQEDDARYAISGTSNAVNRYGRFPVVLGRHRLFMSKTASGYTETQGEDIYYHGRLTFGYGPVALEDLKIGTTSILDFEDVEIEFRNVDQVETEAMIAGIGDKVIAWRSGDDAMTLYPDAIREDAYSVAHEESVDVIRETRDATSVVSVDTSFNGLVSITSKNAKKDASVSFDFAYRLVGDTDWTDAGSETYTAKLTSMVRFSKRWELPVAGRYQIKVTRTTAVSDETDLRDASYLSSIRSIKQGALPSHSDIAEMAVRIRASEQLQGQIDQFNAIVCQMAPVWDGVSWSAYQKVRHPAWVYARALMGPFTKRPRIDSQMDLSAIKAWADDFPDWTCDYVVGSETRFAEVLDIICAAGRGRRTLADLKYSVLLDGADGPVVGHITPRNSEGFQASLAFPKEIHGFRIRVVSERAEWQTDEILVYADGYDASTATEFETLDLPGVVLTATDDTQGNPWKLGRYHLAVHKLRPEVFTVNLDLEHMRLTRGAKVRLVHDVPLIGLGQGRVKSVTEADGKVTIIELDDHIPVEDGQPIRLHIRGQDLEETTIGVFSGVPYLSDPDGAPDGFKVAVPAGTISIGDLALVESVEVESFEALVAKIIHIGDLKAEVTLVPASPAVLTADSGVIPDYDPLITRIPSLEALGPALPVMDSLQSDENTMLENPDGSLLPRIRAILGAVSTSDLRPDYWQIRWRDVAASEQWVQSEIVPLAQRQIMSAALVVNTVYDVEYRSIDAKGATRNWVSAGQITALTTDAAPADVLGFTGSVAAGQVQLDWQPLTVRDVRGYEIRYTPDFSGTWAGASYADYVTHPGTRSVLPGRPGRYLIRAVDFGGVRSINAVPFDVAEDLVSGENVVETLTCDPAWTGTLTDVVIATSELKLDTDVSGFLSTGSYTSGTTIDLGEVYPCGLTAFADVRGFNSQNILDDWPVLDDLGPIGGGSEDSWGIVIEIRTTEDDPSGSPVWSDWRSVGGGTVLARGFQLRITLNSFATNVSPVVSGLTLFVDMPDRVAGDDNVSASASPKSITFSPAFRVTPAIVVTPQDLGTGDYYTVTNMNRTGFDVAFFDSSDTAKAATFDWVARGYGKEIT